MTLKSLLLAGLLAASPALAQPAHPGETAFRALYKEGPYG